MTSNTSGKSGVIHPDDHAQAGGRWIVMTGHMHGSSFVLNAAGQAQALAKVVEEALVDFGLVGAFQTRSADQREGYISWIASAERQETKHERIAVMLDELARIEKSAGIGSGSVDRVDFRSTHKQEVES